MFYDELWHFYLYSILKVTVIYSIHNFHRIGRGKKNTMKITISINIIIEPGNFFTVIKYLAGNTGHMMKRKLPYIDTT